MHRFCSEDVERAQVPAKTLILGKLGDCVHGVLTFSKFCSKDNPNCTCTHGQNPWDDEANPRCPVTGHSDW